MRKEHNISTEIPLPNGFTRLNYIESTGTQYIDTGYYVGNKKTRIVADFIKKSPLYERGVLFACCSPSDNQAFFNPYYGTTFGNNCSSLAFYALGRSLISVIPSRLNTHVLFDVTVDIPNSTAYVHVEQGNDILQFDTNTSTIYNNSIGLLAQHSGTTFNAKVSAQLYKFEIYENDILAHNFIPAKRDSDDAVGLYDVIAGQFMINKGTGNFLYN